MSELRQRQSRNQASVTPLPVLFSELVLGFFYRIELLKGRKELSVVASVFRSCCILSVFLLAPLRHNCHGAGSDSPTVRIDVRHSDEAIRQELMDYTPLGSKATVVLEFVHTRLYCGAFSSSVGIVPRAGVGVRLGDYPDGPFMRTAVDANWRFDKHRNLQSIEIRRVSGKANSNPANDPTVEPKVKIDLHHSNRAIRKGLLQYTPLGSQMSQIGRFLGLRLYSQSGIADGVALTGKPGIAVILGERGTGTKIRAKAYGSFGPLTMHKDYKVFISVVWEETKIAKIGGQSLLSTLHSASDAGFLAGGWEDWGQCETLDNLRCVRAAMPIARSRKIRA